MTHYDDDDLISGLQHGLAERGTGIRARDGIGDDARRAARRRTVTRTVAAGVPVLAAAGVVGALTLGTSSGSASRSGVGARTGAGDGSAASAPVGSGHAEDTAYVVKRIKARVAGDRREGTVTYERDYVKGAISADGSLTDLGTNFDYIYQYFAPGGSIDTASTGFDPHSSATFKESFDLRPVGASYTLTRTLIDSPHRTYCVNTFPHQPNPYDSRGNPYDARPNLQSSPTQIRRVLRSGHVTNVGSSTVDGTPTIGLKIAEPPVDGAAQPPVYLLVDARTYQPLRWEVDDKGVFLSVIDWMPTTAADIARAEDDTIPAGYTRVSDSQELGTTH